MDITLEILGIFPSVINDSLYIRIEDDIYYNLAKCINQKLQINFHLLKNIEIFKLKKKQNKINICLCTKNKKTFNELAKTDLDPFNETKWVTLSNYRNKKKFNTFRLNIKMIAIPHKKKQTQIMNNSMQFNGNDSFLNESIISNASSNTNIFNLNNLNNISISSEINNNSVMNNILNNSNNNNFSLINNNKNKFSNNSLKIKKNDKKIFNFNNKLKNNNTTKYKKIIKSEKINKKNDKINKKTFTSAKNVPKITKNKLSKNNIFFTPLDLNKKIFTNMIVKNKNIINNNDKIIDHINNTEILNDLSIIDKFEKDIRIDFSNTNNNTSFDENLFSEDTEFSKRNSRKIDDLVNFNSNLSYKEKYLEKKNDFFLLYDKNYFKNLKFESFDNLKLESNLIFDKILEIFLAFHLVVKYKILKQKKYFINYKLNSEYYFSLKKIYSKFKQFKEKFNYKNNLINNKKKFNPNENKIYLNEFHIIKSIKKEHEQNENKNKLKNIFHVLFKKNKFFINNEYNKLLSKKCNNYLKKFINYNKSNNKNIKKSLYKK